MRRNYKVSIRRAPTTLIEVEESRLGYLKMGKKYEEEEWMMGTESDHI